MNVAAPEKATTKSKSNAYSAQIPPKAYSGSKTPFLNSHRVFYNAILA